MDEVRCNICDSDNEFEISNTGRFGLKIRSVVCKECGLVYTNPRLDHNENHMFYKYFYKIFFRGDDNPTTRHIQNQRKNNI